MRKQDEARQGGATAVKLGQSQRGPSLAVRNTELNWFEIWPAGVSSWPNQISGSD